MRTSSAAKYISFHAFWMKMQLQLFQISTAANRSMLLGAQKSHKPARLFSKGSLLRNLKLFQEKTEKVFDLTIEADSWVNDGGVA
jgi:hypothetical protein